MRIGPTATSYIERKMLIRECEAFLGAFLPKCRSFSKCLPDYRSGTRCSGPGFPAANHLQSSSPQILVSLSTPRGDLLCALAVSECPSLVSSALISLPSSPSVVSLCCQRRPFPRLVPCSSFHCASASCILTLGSLSSRNSARVC